MVKMQAGQVFPGDVLRRRYYGGPTEPKFHELHVLSVTRTEKSVTLIGTAGASFASGYREWTFRKSTLVEVVSGGFVGAAGERR